MKKKVFEHNYKSKGEAIEDLENAGYWYCSGQVKLATVL